MGDVERFVKTHITPAGKRPLMLVGTWMTLVLAASLMVGMGQLSGLLGAIADSNGNTASMDVLTRVHLRPDVIVNAVRIWASSPATRGLAEHLIAWGIAFDAVFIVLYGLVLWRFVLWASEFVPSAAKRLTLFLLGAVLADVLEDVASLAVADRVGSGHVIGTAWAYVAWLATWAKWLGILATVVFGLAVRVFQPALLVDEADTYGTWSSAAKAQAHLVRYAGQAAGRRGDRRRVWSRLRVQIVCVAIFALAVAFPVGSALQQVPDTIRTLADRGWAWPWLLGLRLLPVAGLLTPAIWYAGRIALLDQRVGPTGPSAKSRSIPSRTLLLLTLLGAAAIGFAYWLLNHRTNRFRIDAASFAVVGVGAGLLLLNWIVGGQCLWSGDTDEGGPVDVPTGDNRRDVRHASLILTVLPVSAFGIGVVRAFLPQALIDPSSRFVLITVAGFAIAIGGSAFGFYVMKLLERRVLQDERIERGEVAAGNVPAAKTVPRVIGGLVIAALLASIGCLAFVPLRAAPHFHGVGVVAVFLATLIVALGFVQYRSEIRTPLPMFTTLKLERTPAVTLILIVFVAAGFIGANSNYHDVRVTATRVRLDNTTIASEVQAWATQATACSAAQKLSGASIPMLFVAAPGGGIRAAYWTDHALGYVQQQPCGRQRVFAASGVSGGSVGLALRYAPTNDTGMPTDPHFYPSDRLATESALSTNTAGEFFRDLPASLLGVSRGWDDRAGLFERVWVKDDSALQNGFYTTMKPGPPDGADVTVWRPVIVFNGTEVATGCRILVSPLRLAAPIVSQSASDCRGQAIRPGTDQIVPGALNEQDFGGAGSSCPAGTALDLSIATAAHLSARFPYVSPTGGLHGCRAAAATSSAPPGNTDVAITDSDGGANENSGMDTLIDIYGAARPAIDTYNRTHKTKLRPVLVLLHNSYLGTGAPAKTKPAPQLLAPRSLLSAGALGSDEQVIVQRAELKFGPQVYEVAPQRDPSVQAPLGWTLSKITQDELSDQITKDRLATCPAAGSTDGLVPLGLPCLVKVLAGSG